MNKKTFLICFFITILAVGMAFFVISQKNLTTQETPLGNFVFEKKAAKIADKSLL